MIDEAFRAWLRAMVTGQWIAYGFGVAGWLALSFYLLVAHDDAGALVGGGIAVVIFGAAVASLHVVLRRLRGGVRR